MDVPLRAVSGRKCRVLFSYQPANDDELELKVGEIIDILNEVEEGWWKGKLNGQVGVFPSNFVSEILDETSDAKEASHRKTSKSSLDLEASKQANAAAMSDEPAASSSDTPELPPKPKKELCRVLFPYEAVNDDELTLREGDIITLISREGQDVGWWRGELNGRLGVFPDNFVQIVPAEETTRPARPPAKTNLLTTNRVKDSITRPNAAPQTTAHRKSLELPSKPEEKTSPPGLSKKPSLPPPPLKKPQRSPSGASINKTVGAAAESKPPDSPTHNAPAKMPLTPLTFTLKQNSTSTTNQTSDKPTTTKPDPDATDGGVFSRSSGSFTLNNHDSDNEGELDLDCVGRSAMLSHPTASRVRAPRRRPPTTSPREGSEAGMVNGNADSHFQPEDKVNRPPWVEELKLNQAKKNSAQGRTRVMIGSGGGGGEAPTSPSPDPPKVSPSAVTLRGGSSQPAQSGSRPQSMFGSRSFSLSPSPSSPDTITVSHKHWSELNDKVQRLEEKLNTQHDSFTLAIRELTNKLNAEVERRQLMQAELEKLSNFVTQV